MIEVRVMVALRDPAVVPEGDIPALVIGLARRLRQPPTQARAGRTEPFTARRLTAATNAGGSAVPRAPGPAPVDGHAS